MHEIRFQRMYTERRTTRGVAFSSQLLKAMIKVANWVSDCRVQHILNHLLLKYKFFLQGHPQSHSRPNLGQFWPKANTNWMHICLTRIHMLGWFSSLPMSLRVYMPLYPEILINTETDIRALTPRLYSRHIVNTCRSTVMMFLNTENCLPKIWDKILHKICFVTG